MKCPSLDPQNPYFRDAKPTDCSSTFAHRPDSDGDLSRRTRCEREVYGMEWECSCILEGQDEIPSFDRSCTHHCESMGQGPPCLLDSNTLSRRQFSDPPQASLLVGASWENTFGCGRRLVGLGEMGSRIVAIPVENPEDRAQRGMVSGYTQRYINLEKEGGSK